MIELITSLSKGKYLPKPSESKLVQQMLASELVFEQTDSQGKKVYTLDKHIIVGNTQNGATELLVPTYAKYFGLFFLPHPKFACKEPNMVPVKNHHITLMFMPSDQELDKVSHLLNKQLQVKAIARGANSKNEALLVALPNLLKTFCTNRAMPHITLGVAVGGKARESAKLNYNQPENFELVGRFGIMTNHGLTSSLSSMRLTKYTYTLSKKQGLELKNFATGVIEHGLWSYKHVLEKRLGALNTKNIKPNEKEC